jgi:hypothetical protein
MSTRDELVLELVNIISDYRTGEINKPDSKHVDTWLAQFDSDKQEAVLSEVLHVFKKTYISRASMIGALSSVAEFKPFVGDTPRNHWSTATVLDIQKGGNSQHELAQLLKNVVNEKYGVEVSINKMDNLRFYYIDDNLCSGSRAIQDLTAWIEGVAPSECQLNLYFVVLHTYGYWRVSEKIKSVIASCGKNIKVEWAWCIQPEDRKSCNYNADVLRPVSAPDSEAVNDYIESMVHKPVYRVAGGKGELDIFSSEAARNLLEQEFLVKGVDIRSKCTSLKDQHRPLGYSGLETLGFGSMIVTYRNCPNNAPLALWVGDPWYPLLPRATNNDAKIRRMFENW